MVHLVWRRSSVAAALVVGALSVCGCGAGQAVSGDPASTTTTTTPTAPTTTTPASTTPTTTTATTPTTLPAMTPTGPAAALFRLAVANAEAEQWVHGVSRTGAEGSGGTDTTFISDDGPDRGTQEITIGKVAGDIRVLGALTYIRGGPEALADLFAVPAAIAAELGPTWFTLHPGDSEYVSVTEGVTISSFLNETAFSGHVTEGSTKLGATPATALSGKLASSVGSGTGVLYVSRGARPLPLEWKIVESGGTTTTTYSAWGHAVTVTAPPGAVPPPGRGGGDHHRQPRPPGLSCGPAP